MKELTGQDYAQAARFLACEEAAIRAVAEVESAGAGFLPNGAPKILYERHIFHKMTRGEHSYRFPEISNPKPGGYLGGVEEYKRLDKAISVSQNTEAAHSSCSWGKFQIMGFNHKVCGFDSLGVFVEHMHASEWDHLMAFCGFIMGTGLDDELRRRDWAGFAKGYNGPGYKKNRYDTRMAAAYAKYSQAFIVGSVGDIQQALTELGLDPGPIDGIYGPKTASGIRGFERTAELPVRGAVTKQVMSCIQSAYHWRLTDED